MPSAARNDRVGKRGAEVVLRTANLKWQCLPGASIPPLIVAPYICEQYLDECGLIRI